MSDDHNHYPRALSYLAALPKDALTPGSPLRKSAQSASIDFTCSAPSGGGQSSKMPGNPANFGHKPTEWEDAMMRYIHAMPLALFIGVGLPASLVCSLSYAEPITYTLSDARGSLFGPSIGPFPSTLTGSFIFNLTTNSLDSVDITLTTTPLFFPSPLTFTTPLPSDPLSLSAASPPPIATLNLTFGT